MGISFFVSLGTDTRSSALGTFNSASSAWDGTGFAAFKASAGNFTAGATAAQTVFLSAQSGSDTYPDRDGANVPAKSLYFYGAGTPLAPFSSWAPLTTGTANPQVLNLARNGAAGSTFPVPVSPLYSSSTSMKCKSTSSSSTSSDCSPSCSTYVTPTSGTTRTCHTFFVISKICLVVDPATGALDGGGRGGCAVNPDSRVPANVNMKDGTTQLAQFDFAAVGGSGLPSPSQGYTNIPITVRASTDPYVVMLRLTQGGMNFGLTTAQKISSGIAFTVAGLLFTCCVYGGLYYFVTNCQNRKPGFIASAAPPQQTLVIMGGEPQPYKPQPMYPMGMGQQQMGMGMGGGGYPPPNYPAASYPPPMQQPYPAYPPMQQPMPQAYGGQQQYPQAGYGSAYPPQQQGSNV